MNEWIPTGTPPVLKGHRETYLVTVEQKNGERGVTTAVFANEYWMEWSDYACPPDDEIDDNNGKKWSGWMVDAVDSCGDDISLSFTGNVVAWMRFPEPWKEAE